MIFVMLFAAAVTLACAAQAKTAKSAKSGHASVAKPAPGPASEADREAMADALAKGELAKAQALHKKGVDYNSLGADELTGLMRLADEGDDIGVKNALALPGVDLNAKNAAGENALWYAVYSGHEKLALSLLARGASAAGQKPDTKECLMHMAAQAGLSELGAKLMKATPKCASQKDQDGRTPSDVAKSLGYDKLAKVLTPGKSSNK